MSPVRPSFYPKPDVYPRPLFRLTTHHHQTTFVGPFFSWSYELLFPQLLSFDNHLRCPLVFSNRVSPQKHSACASSTKSFIYRFYAESPANSFIYRISEKQGGVAYPSEALRQLRALCVSALSLFLFCPLQPELARVC